MPLYLIHFHTPLGHAKHYLGAVRPGTPIAARIDSHRRSRGARILQVCNERGIVWSVVRTWGAKDGCAGRESTFQAERRFKKRSSTPLCPVCAGRNPQPHTWRYNKPYGVERLVIPTKTQKPPTGARKGIAGQS